MSLNTRPGFRDNFIKVSKSNLVSQALPLAVSPVLTRLYEPSDFGVLALFVGIITLLIPVSIWRFDWSIPGASSRKISSILFLIGVNWLVFFCMLTTLFIGFFEYQGYSFFQVSNLGVLVWLVPFALFANGLQSLLQGLYVYKGDLSDLATNKMYQSFITTVLGVLFGVFYFGSIGLVMAGVLASGICLFLLYRKTRLMIVPLRKFKTKTLRVVFLGFVSQASISTLVSIVGALNIATIPFLLAYYYGTAELGWYALMLRIVVSPVSVFGTALSQSFWAEARMLIKNDKGRLRALYLKVSEKLFLIAIPACGACALGPYYIGLIFGVDDWAEAGFVLASLAPMVFGILVVQPLTHLIVHKKQHWKLYLDLVRLILILSIVPTLGAFGVNLSTVVFAISMIALLSYAVLFYLNLRCLRC